jgi:hypothetical protein
MPIRSIALLALAVMVASCSDQPQSPAAPSTPVQVVNGAGGSPGAAGAVPRQQGAQGPAQPATAGGLPGGGSLIPSGDRGMGVINFPGRQDPYDFRLQLETKYRVDLKRSAVQSYVDIEGSIVWTQEYLRYRLNGCGHAEAVDRVMRQIDGQGIIPVCGGETPGFPPRNEPFDFRLQLEAKYRDGLKRQPSSTYVDTEGDIVWTQEYLRYRVDGCQHAESVQKVFDQIDGKGIQPTCGDLKKYAGRWKGDARITACSQTGDFVTIGWCDLLEVGTTDYVDIKLDWSGSALTGVADIGGVTFPVTGSSAAGGGVQLSGGTTLEGILLNLENWNTSLSGSGLTGQFGWVATYSGLSGWGRNTLALVGVSKGFSVEAAEGPMGGGRLSEKVRRASGAIKR